MSAHTHSKSWDHYFDQRHFHVEKEHFKKYRGGFRDVQGCRNGEGREKISSVKAQVSSTDGEGIIKSMSFIIMDTKTKTIYNLNLYIIPRGQIFDRHFIIVIFIRSEKKSRKSLTGSFPLVMHIWTSSSSEYHSNFCTWKQKSKPHPHQQREGKTNIITLRFSYFIGEKSIWRKFSLL